jgi:hypothetical protein
MFLVLLQARALRWKLTTRRRDGAGDGFRDKHTDLSPEQLQQQEQHLVQQVRWQGQGSTRGADGSVVAAMPGSGWLVEHG